jgi:hypothetical protein
VADSTTYQVRTSGVGPGRDTSRVRLTLLTSFQLVNAILVPTRAISCHLWAKFCTLRSFAHELCDAVIAAKHAVALKNEAGLIEELE